MIFIIKNWRAFRCVVLFFASILFCDVVRPFVLSDNDEVELGNKFKAQILADPVTYPPFKGDQRVSQFVDSLGRVLSSVQKDRSTLVFTFTILEDTTMNAFAIPGGHVFVHTGLLKAVRNSAELAGVLAHEIGHITQYHGADRLVGGEFVGFVNQILFGNEATISSAVSGLLENMAFMQLSQKDEFEADSCAVAYTSSASINPKGMYDFLGILKDTYGESPKIFEPFSTHPPLTERMDRVKHVINNTTGAPIGETALYRDEYQVIKLLLK
jgi:predicted Zn-dependent protease